MSEDGIDLSTTTKESSDKAKWVKRGAVAAVGVLSAVGTGSAINNADSASKVTPKTEVTTENKSDAPEILPGADMTSTVGAPGPEVASNTISEVKTSSDNTAHSENGGMATEIPVGDSGNVPPEIATGNSPDTAHGENGGMPTEIPTDPSAGVPPEIAHGNAPDTTHGENGGMATEIPKS